MPITDTRTTAHEAETKQSVRGRPHVEFGIPFVLINAFLFVAVSVALALLLVVRPWTG